MGKILENNLHPEEKDLLSELSSHGLSNQEKIKWLRDIIECRV